MEEQNNGGIPTPTVEKTTEKQVDEQSKVEEQTNKGVSFDAQQQAKLNSLIKEEREKVLQKLGVASLEEAMTKLEKANKYDTLESESKSYKEKASRVEELVGENAMLKANIRDDAKEVVKGYFKGIGKELNDENLKAFFETNPTFKTQWVKSERANVVVGNQKGEEDNNNKDGYQKFLNDAGLKRY